MTNTDESGHTKLIVWQKAMELALLVYEISKAFPSEEKFGITSQVRRSAVSIPSNIAEGRSRGTRKDYAQFLHVALGSAAELETQLTLAYRLSIAKNPSYTTAIELLKEVRRMLFAMVASLKSSTS